MPDVKPIPEGYPRITPYLHVSGADAAIEFYNSVLGAQERMRMPAPGGKVGHAEVEIGESIIMLADEFPDMDVRGPKAIGGTPVTLHVYVDDVDAVFDAALAAGATSGTMGRRTIVLGLVMALGLVVMSDLAFSSSRGFWQTHPLLAGLGLECAAARLYGLDRRRAA